MKTKQQKSFWNSKSIKCKKCGAKNMLHWIKLYGCCGKCGGGLAE